MKISHLKIKGLDFNYITDGIYIGNNKCCKGHFDEPQCQTVCPVDCIPLDPDNQESEAELMDKYHKLQSELLD